MFNYKPHPKQLEFFNDNSERVLYGGGLPTRGHYNWVMKRFLENKMPGPVNKSDILDTLKAVPSPVFDAVMIQVLNVDTHEYQNNKPIDDLKRQIQDYYGLQKVDGNWEPRPELNGDARRVAQELVDNFLQTPV